MSERNQLAGQPGNAGRRETANVCPTAVVLNLFYTGLGIARSLGERGIPVIGLTAQRGIYGNFTRYAQVLFAPDSRDQPEALLAFLLQLAEKLDSRAVIFPTRDDDLVFLDRYRAELQRRFRIVAPAHEALATCLSKWATHGAAARTGIASPKSWLIESSEDLERATGEARFPCVLKPLSSHHWRQGTNWQIVGARKAIGVRSAQELEAEYQSIARADSRAILEEMVPGGDDCLFIVACYIDRQSRWAAAFNTQKLVQIPEGFGTGCIVQSVKRPELFAPTARLLAEIGFQGIAEVEYKWDAGAGEFKLIEINPRAWDQHRLGAACGVDLIHLAYCDHAGLDIPKVAEPDAGHKWIAEDTFVTTALRLLWNRDRRLAELWRQARGKRLFAIWSWRDPLPLVAYLITRFIPEFLRATWQRFWNVGLGARGGSASGDQSRGPVYESRLAKRKSVG